MKSAKDSFLLKADFVPLTVIKLSSANLAEFEKKWVATVNQAPRYFEHAPIVIDVKSMPNSESLDLQSLCKTLKTSKIIPVGIKGLAKKHHAEAINNGLAILKSETQPTTSSTSEKAVSAQPTKIVTKPVRAGTQVYAKDADLIVMASVNPGAEVIADGNIHIYGPLRGKALAGAMGDTNANIFCESCDAELISIAGRYLVKENLQVPKISKPMIRISLMENQLNIEGI